MLGIGTRLQQQLDWGIDDDLKIVHLDIDAARSAASASRTWASSPMRRKGFGRSSTAGEAQRQARQPNRRMKALKGALAEDLARSPAEGWIDAIRAELPEDGILVEELTQVSYASRLLFPFWPRTYLTTGYQGTLGWGLPTALGAKAAMPGRPWSRSPATAASCSACRSWPPP